MKKGFSMGRAPEIPDSTVCIPMSIYEIVGVAFGLWCVWLTVKESIWNWPVGIISVVAFLLLFIDIKLYADVALQVFYIITGFYGWYLWKYGGVKNSELRIATLSLFWRIAVALALVPTIYLVGWYLSVFTDASFPFWDATASGLSVIAQILLMKKYLENWVLWIAVNVLSIGIYFAKGVYLTSGLYMVFLVLASMGLAEWYKTWKTQRTTIIQENTSLEVQPA